MQTKMAELSNETVDILGCNHKVEIKRESGLELLRIISMIFIVMHHVYLYGGITMHTDLEMALARMVGSGGKLGVNIFILISSYFMVCKKFKLTRILNIIIQTTFYSITIFALFQIFGDVEYTLNDLVYAFLPVLYQQWWFVTAYVLLILISPALNIIIKSVKKKTLGWSILLMVGFSVLFPYFNWIVLKEFYETPYLNELFVFIELYFIGGYIKLYGINLKKSIIAIITCLMLAVGLRLTFIGYWRELGTKESSLFNVVCSTGIFLIFKDFKFRSKFVNLIASTTFGIYLIHENRYMRDWVYNFCKTKFFLWVSSSALMFLLLTITIFVFSMLVDLIRLQIIHRLTKKLLNFVDTKIENRKNKQKQINNGSINR